MKELSVLPLEHPSESRIEPIPQYKKNKLPAPDFSKALKISSFQKKLLGTKNDIKINPIGNDPENFPRDGKPKTPMVQNERIVSTVSDSTREKNNNKIGSEQKEKKQKSGDKKMKPKDDFIHPSKNSSTIPSIDSSIASDSTSITINSLSNNVTDSLSSNVMDSKSNNNHTDSILNENDSLKITETSPETKDSLASSASSASSSSLSSQGGGILNISVPGFQIGPITRVVHDANLWFLGIFIVMYLGFYIMFGSGTSGTMRIIDLIGILFLIFYCIRVYFENMTNFTAETWNGTMVELFEKTLSWLRLQYNEKTLWQSSALFLFLLYVTVYFLNIPMDYYKPLSIAMVENIAWFVTTTQIFHLALVHWFDINVFDFIPVWSELKDSSNVVENNLEEKDEVFNISENIYTYPEAKHVCAAHGAKLANYSEIEDAYRNGGEWCNYGWSENQMIFYPTQKETWNALQSDPLKKNSCGRPGVNGGFMENPKLTFGVNCFGKRPKKTDNDIQQKHSVIPTTIPTKLNDEEYIKYKKSKIYSFNRDKWSFY